ncbi:hypothetical protein COOONC_20072 [Cooperia oncophora]
MSYVFPFCKFGSRLSDGSSSSFDLDALFYDDLQNDVHERLARPGPHSVTDFLNTWESIVRQYTSTQDTFAQRFCRSKNCYRTTTTSSP